MSNSAGCLCGRVRITINGEPVRVRTCWCRDCQYWGAGNGTTNAAYRMTDLEIAGDVSWYESIADSGDGVKRGFCGQCGTPLFTANTGPTDFMAIRAGALDNPSSVTPTETIWTASAPSWAPFDPNLPQSEGQPPPIG